MKEIKNWIYTLIGSVILSIIISIALNYPFFSSLRAVLGLIYVLFLPGYIVVRCFFKKDLDWIEKGALSMGLSIALVILSVMISNLLFGIPITTLSNILVILVVIIITLLLKKYNKEIRVFLKKIKLMKK